jgi:hypothetical protein
MADVAALRDQISELESWRHVHRTLIEAVKVSEAAVAAQKTQRRYWLEEICANLGDGGLHQQSSLWKRPVPIKPKLPSKRPAVKPNVIKRKASFSPGEAKSAKKPRPRKSIDGGAGKLPSKLKKLKTDNVARGPTPDVGESRMLHSLAGASDYVTESSVACHAAASQPTAHWAGAQNLQMMVSTESGIT